MSALRKFLIRPGVLLAVLALCLLVILADTLRPPPKQLLAKAYVLAIREGYQPVFRPIQKGRVRCRYLPSCSDYSIGAVQKFGFWRGLAMSYRRIDSCRTSVPPGTPDPVPDA
jgi:putative component of membrane protein insertase Oxa1/YidC/SpoIIIJ protein YidD